MFFTKIGIVLMPAETSAQISNSTNGIEPIRSLVITKKSKSGLVKQVAPECIKLKNKYEMAFDMPDNRGYTNICAIIQKWIDQGISMELLYNLNNDITAQDIYETIFTAWEKGCKTIYYTRTIQKNSNIMNEQETCVSCAN